MHLRLRLENFITGHVTDVILSFSSCSFLPLIPLLLVNPTLSPEVGRVLNLYNYPLLGRCIGDY